jgi:protein ImuB
MKRRREAEARTADLFAAVDASPAMPAVPMASAVPAFPAPRFKPRAAPAAQTAGHARSKQLWYAAVFPQLTETEPSGRMLQRLCLHAQTFTSFVSIEPPNALLLEIKGSLRLLGPLKTLHANIDACWRGLAMQAYSATAPSTLAALWLARGGSAAQIEDLGALAGHLAQLPIACTAWDGERLQTLRAMGVTRVGELQRLPRAGLARRLGTAAVRDLDIALAREFAPRRAFVPRERFRARCDFESEIETVAYLQKAVEPLVKGCARFLRERQAGVQTLRLKLRHRAGPATRVHLGLASITGEYRRLMDVLVQKLARLELEAPVRGMELISGSLQPLSAASLDAFAGVTGTGGRDTAPQCGGRKPKPTPAGRPQGERQDGASQLVERLRARLGEEAVYGVVSIPEHRPEAAWRRVQELSLATASRMGGKIPDRGAGDCMPRPVWLLDTPLPLPEPHPHQSHPSVLVLEQGPERIESGWWDGRGVGRDYYVARHLYGAKLWVFQERQSKRWYLHGMFA